MGVEGLWYLQMTSVQDPGEFQHGGVVVIENERVFGADHIYSYLGDYRLQGDEVVANIRIRTWNKDLPSENIFGLRGPLDYQAEVRGKRKGDAIDGTISPLDAPDLKLPIRMHFIADLP